MTILVSTTLSNLIVMLSDSAVTLTHEQEDGSSFKTYEIDSKFLRFPNVGCITTWGDHTGNHLGEFLHSQHISPATHTVTDLAKLAEKYLHECYSKDDELGFHIAGFDQAGTPRLYHTFFGFDRPPQPTQTEREHRFYDHSTYVFLYNGRNDLAAIALMALEANIRSGQDTRFDLRTPLGRIMLCDLVARFAAEITPQVGPPFDIHLIFPDNRLEKICNTSLSPLSLQSVIHLLPELSQPSPPKTPPAPAPDPNIPPDNLPTGTPSRDLPDIDYRGGTVPTSIPPISGDS
ncbi:MAG: hypothetical protein IT318_25905 [Anaerolineales bacterium]|nr:hypothetical protein [Anaerolineales bacterium]